MHDMPDLPNLFDFLNFLDCVSGMHIRHCVFAAARLTAALSALRIWQRRSRQSGRRAVSNHQQ
jgi:hypothetical protein